MGNKQSQEQTKPQQQQQQQQQPLQQENNQFNQLFDAESIDGTISINSLAKILKLPECLLTQRLPQFVENLFTANNLNHQQWCELAEILLRAPDYNNSRIPKLNRIALLVSIMGYDEQSSVTNEVALEILQSLFAISNSDNPNAGIEAAQLFMNRLIDDTMDDNQRVGYIVNKINSVIPMLSDKLFNHWNCVLNNGNIGNKIKLLDPTQILNDSHLYLFGLNPQLCKDWQLLYSTNHSGTSFNRLAWNIIGYEGPTIIVIKAEQKQFFKGTQYPIIFGGYNPKTWSDQLEYQGDQGCFMYSLSHCFRYIMANGGDNKYAYLNTRKIDKSKYQIGLGFGGEYNKYRIWIDDDVEGKSSVCPEDNTYQPGYSAGEIDGEFKTLTLEIWGLGGQKALDKQEQYRRELQEELERMRKVDKKQFFNSFDQQMFFGKTFAHQGQVREDATDD